MTKKTDSKRELAELLSAVMKHPELPEKIYNKLGDYILEMSCDIDFDSADIIEKSLRAFEAKNKKRRAK